MFDAIYKKKMANLTKTFCRKASLEVTTQKLSHQHKFCVHPDLWMDFYQAFWMPAPKLCKASTKKTAFLTRNLCLKSSLEQVTACGLGVTNSLQTLTSHRKWDSGSMSVKFSGNLQRSVLKSPDEQQRL